MGLRGGVYHRELRMPEGVESLGPQLAAHARLLAAAEGSRVVVEQRGVYPDHARLEFLDRAHRLVEIPRIDRRAERVLGTVGQLYGLLEARDSTHRRDRSKGLGV